MKRISHSIFIYPVIFLLVISCGSTPLPKNNSVRVPHDFFGMVHAGITESDEEYSLLKEMNVVWILETFYWGRIEWEPGNFNFSRYDRYVDKAIMEGKKIIAVLAYDASWLNNGRQRYVSPENIPHFLNYVEETVRHFQGRVDVWSVWNEPNFLFWSGSDSEFFELSRLATQRIRETDPDAYIIGGAFWRTPAGFIRGMHRAGAMEGLDGIAFHPYALNPVGSMRLHDRFLNVLSEINFTGPVWITEMGYPTNGWFPLKISMEELPSYVVKTIAGSAARGARVFLWYDFFDHFNEGEIPKGTSLTKKTEASYGLAYPNYQRKNGSYAYELCSRFLPGSRYAPELPIRENIPESIVCFSFLEGAAGNNTLILWNDTGTINVNLMVPGPAVIYDISTGAGSPLLPEASLAIGSEPLFITWQGTDIPRLSAR